MTFNQPLFTADLQARRRLGLTATLVREDGREGDVFSLIGPKRYDAPAECTEVRVTLTDAERMSYATAESEERYRMAATARTKLPVVKALVDRHRGDQVLVIGAYIDQLHQLGEYLDAPIIQGSTTNSPRQHGLAESGYRRLLDRSGPLLPREVAQCPSQRLVDAGDARP